MTWQTRTLDAETPYSVIPKVIEKINNRDGQIDLPFPIESLNTITGGIPKNRITTISARTSHGKSAFLLQSAMNLAEKDKNIIWISLEEDREQIVERQLSYITKINNRDIFLGKIKFDKEIKTRFKNFRMYLIDAYGFFLIISR